MENIIAAVRLFKATAPPFFKLLKEAVLPLLLPEPVDGIDDGWSATEALGFGEPRKDGSLVEALLGEAVAIVIGLGYFRDDGAKVKRKDGRGDRTTLGLLVRKIIVPVLLGFLDGCPLGCPVGFVGCALGCPVGDVGFDVG